MQRRLLALLLRDSEDAWVRYIRRMPEELTAFDEIVVFDDGMLVDDETRASLIRLPLPLTYRFSREKLGLAAAGNLLLDYAGSNGYGWMRLVSMVDETGTRIFRHTMEPVADEQVVLIGNKRVAKGLPDRLLQWAARQQTAPEDGGFAGMEDVWCRVEALRQLGGWDTDYYMTHESVDLCVRVLQAGYRVRLAGSKADKRKRGGGLEAYFAGRNEYLLLKKVGKAMGWYDKLIGLVRSQVVDFIAYLRIGRGRAYLSGVRDGLKLLFTRQSNPNKTS